MTLQEIAAGVAAAQATFESIKNSVTSYLSEKVGQVADTFYEATSPVSVGLYQGLSSSSDYVDSAVSTIKGWVQDKLSDVSNWIDKTETTLKESLTEGLNTIGDTVAGVYDSTFKWFSSQLDDIEGAVGQISDEVYSALAPAFSAIDDTLAQIPVSLEHFISAGVNALLDFGKQLAQFQEALMKKLEDLLTFSDEEAQTFIEEYKKKFK